MLDPATQLNLSRLLLHVATAIVFGGFVLMLAGEALFPRDTAVRPWRRMRHGGHKLRLWIAGIAVMSVVFGSTLWLALRGLQFHRIGILYLVALPPWLHAALAFVLFDACDYFFHRLSHNTRWLWLLHAVHHSDKDVDVTTNLRQHPVHLICTQLWKLVACAAIGVPTWVFLSHEILVMAFAHLHHSAIRWPRWIDSAFSWLVVTPRMHWSHHSPEPAQTNRNYGLILSLLSDWDRAFDTLTVLTEAVPLFGLSELGAKTWHSAWGMFVTPWRARAMSRL